MDINRIERLSNRLRNLANRPDALNSPVFNSEMVKIHEEFVWIAKDIENEQPLFSCRLMDVKNRLFNEKIVNWNMRVIFINPFAFGQAIEILNILKEENTRMQKDWWILIHPEIKRVSKKLYMDSL